MFSGPIKTAWPRVPLIVILCALAVFLSTAVMSGILFRHVPHVHDEIAYLFQAKVFSLGRLYVPSPAAKESFDFPHMVNNGKWYSQYPPGFPLLLALGLMAGIPWIVNPLLASLSIVVLYHLGTELYGETAGRLAAVLASLSLWFLLTSSTMLSHTACLFFYVLFLLGLFRSLRVPNLGNGLLAGASLGAAFLIRPYDVAVISVPVLVYYGFRSLARLPGRWRNLAALSLTFLVAVAALLVYNKLTNGSPLKMGYIVRYGEAHGIGFGRGGYVGIPHTPARGLFWLGENLKAINKYLFGWPVSSLLFLLPFMVPLREGKDKARTDGLLMVSFLSLAAGMFVYWGSYVFVGPRMYFLALPLLVLMTVRGLQKVSALYGAMNGVTAPASVKRSAYVILSAMTLYAFLWTFPRWIRPSYSDSYFAVFSKDFCGVSDAIHRTIRSLSLDDSVVILKFLAQPQPHYPDGDWGSGFMWDDPLLKETVIYARDRGPANADLLALYPGRRGYLYYGTVERGFLVPVDRTAEGTMRYGSPLRCHAPGEGRAELVAKPQDLFFSYSAEFEKRLDDLYAGSSFIDIDGNSLPRLSEQARAAGDVTGAIFYAEAALQVENDPNVRYKLLARLADLYVRSGNRAVAEHILIRLAARPEPHVYGVFPEKGF